MPLYEYECDACEHRFEVIRRFSDPPVETCPKCGSTVRKLIASPAFQFKGTGWYVTDYAKKKESGDKEKGSSEGAAGDKSAEKTTSEKAPSEKTPSDKTDTAAKSDASSTPPVAPSKAER